MRAGEKMDPLLETPYECARCGTRVSKEELDTLPSARCGSCGFKVFQKVRPAIVKHIAAA